MASSRKSYAIEFKVKVVLSYEKHRNVSQTAREFKIHRKQVQLWVKQRDQLFSAAKRGEDDVRRRRLTGVATRNVSRKDNGKYPDLEKEILSWIAETRNKKR